MSELIEVELARIVIQEKGHQQYIHLREKEGERSFPIVIGFNEAAEINRKLLEEVTRGQPRKASWRAGDQVATSDPRH